MLARCAELRERSGNLRRGPTGVMVKAPKPGEPMDLAVLPDGRTDTFAFILPSPGPVVAGPIRAANGPVEVDLNFTGDFTILACGGTPTACVPMGWRPQTRTFSIPNSFPPGPIQASVYFNPNVTQPSGNASGTVSFTYNPQ